MIPVDLNRLREATESGWTQFENHGDTMVAMPRPRFDEYHQTTRAVLDAPTVWWCAESQWSSGAVWHPITNLDPSSYGCQKAEGCGWVALVPVNGGQE